MLTPSNYLYLSVFRYSGSQTERISILKMALTEKGVIDNSHYDVSDTPPTTNSRRNTAQNIGQEQAQDSTASRATEGMDEDEGGGIDL
jgi:hypothetical protein